MDKEQTKILIALVAEKDPHMKALLEPFLTELGCKVQFVEDGYAALDAARLNTPHVLITEMLLPRLDGLALTRILKSEDATKTLPIIVFSPLDAEHRAKAAGADAFLKKPIEKNKVLNVLKAVGRLDGYADTGAEK